MDIKEVRKKQLTLTRVDEEHIRKTIDLLSQIENDDDLPDFIRDNCGVNIQECVEVLEDILENDGRELTFKNED